MMRRLLGIAAVFAVLFVSWQFLAATIRERTGEADGKLSGQVAALWGDRQEQASPDVTFVWTKTVKDTETVEDPETKKRSFVTKERQVSFEEPRILDASKIAVDLTLDQRKKGLLWYSTYGVSFRGDYAYTHVEAQDGTAVITYRFPTTQAIFDNFRFEVDGKMDPSIVPVDDGDGKVVRARIPVTAGRTVPFTIAYTSRGLETWRYSFGKNVNRVKNFDLTLTTHFKEIDYPEGTISPTSTTATADGYVLRWASENLISGYAIGMVMPQRINPGPLAAEMTTFAPVSLFFFFAWIFVITLMKKIDLHPLNYLFLGAAFFAFHLLFAYSVDHIEVIPAFATSSVVSVFLVVSYLRLAVGLRFAAVEAGLAQLVYLVLFSYAHFFQGFTGLIVTIGSILTLFALMQLTGRIRWSEVEAARAA
ncbi:MAG TPA: inner membrane CreD family protein [Candidatus Polarisedimenticolaceae bacterium]|nr:inner membrane CreD family protein [Candidatus Polarisedimenticolaceae bacterium]